jgi:hypothetical protein
MRLLIAAFGTCIATSALADCVEGMRDTTQRELEFNKRVSAALKEALPVPPPNWTLTPVREQAVGGFCKGEPEGDFEVRVTAGFTYHPPKEEGDRLYAEYKKLQSEVDALKRLPPAVARERQGWLDKMSEANRASNRAAKEGNKALAKQKDSEAEEYSRKGREVRDTYLASVRKQVDDLEARQKTLDYRGSSVSVILVANERQPRRLDPAAASEVVAGRLPTPKSPGLKVHNVRVVMEGPPARREKILAALDRDKLARIVQ